jgi:hypothetical protein
MTYASLEDCSMGSGVFVRMFEAEDGGTGIIDLDTVDSSKALQEFFHPENKKFLKDEVVLLIVGDNAVSCNMKNKSGTCISGMVHLAQDSDLLGKDVKMRVADVPDRTIVERIDQVGVREVDFSITSYLAALDLGVHWQQKPKLFRQLFGLPRSNGADQRKRANAMGRIVLKRGRFKPDEIKRDQWITEIAHEVAQENIPNSYRITLEDGTKISDEKLKKSKSVKISRHANSYDYANAKEEREQFYRELAEQRYVE